MNKLTKAKVQMIVSAPFFATIALSLEYIEDKTIPTACTDGKTIFYNPDYIESLKKEEVVGLLVHEVMHIANLHHMRLQNRDQERFNVAADYTINELILKAGFLLPKGALLDPKYSNMSAEEIYNQLPEQVKKPSYGEFKSGNANLEQEEQRVKVLVAKAAAVAKQQGKFPDSLNRFVEQTLENKVNWREVLVRFMTDTILSDYKWTRPNKRYLPAYLPSMDTIPVLGQIVLIVDTSGSIDARLLDEFSSEVSEICRNMSKDLMVMYVDAMVQSVQVFEPEDHIVLKPKGGGGTDFKPGFSYLDNEGLDPICVIYFTDGECNSFPSEPTYPVLWAIYNNNNFNPPFGETIKIK